MVGAYLIEKGYLPSEFWDGCKGARNMPYENYRSIIGIIQNISRGGDCCTQIINLRTENGIVNFILSGNTRVIDDERLRPGMRIAAFYDETLPVPAIFPPQYRADLIAVLRRDQSIMLNYFDENLIAADNTLRLNLSPVTSINTQNGQRYLCPPENAVLLVYYTRTTFSIPPQTTPQRVIVMCPRT